MLWGMADRQSNKVMVDTTVPECPLCHTSPIVTEKMFDIEQMLASQARAEHKHGRKKARVECSRANEKYCYYHCLCGHCTTDWYGEIEDCNGRRILPPRERARTAYVAERWVGSVDEFAKHRINTRQMKRNIRRMRCIEWNGQDLMRQCEAQK